MCIPVKLFDMNKGILRPIVICIVLFTSFTGYAQSVTSLHENFDVKCVLGIGTPTSWIKYNPIPATDPMGAWTCHSTDGRNGTPGVECTGIYGSMYHLDTSYLLTPMLDLSSYTSGPLYLRFDTKNTKVHLGGRLDFLIVTDSPYVPGVSSYIDSTNGLFPVFGNGDSTGWLTHQFNLNSLDKTHPFYIAFRYTSTDTSGSIWTLDNVNITTFSILDVPVPSKDLLPLTVIGSSTRNEIKISCGNNREGMYHLALYDMLGRELYKDKVSLLNDNGCYTLRGLDLNDDMYVLKMGDGNSYNAVKVVVRGN